jgi:hypothetical protein
MSKTMVFIDSRVNDLDLLVSQFEAGTEYKVLDASYDGLRQMEESLAGKTDYSSIQIISHGAAGEITIGSTVLNSNNLLQYQSQLDNIGHALTDSGDVLLYGCNVAAGATGQQFVESLAQMTGADVAASDDVTGGVAAGGDWQLESATGSIESVISLSDVALKQYDHTLALADDYMLAKMSLVAYYNDPSDPTETDSVKKTIAVNAWKELYDDGWRVLVQQDHGDYKTYITTDDYSPSPTAVDRGYSSTVFKKGNSIVIAYRGTDIFILTDLSAGIALSTPGGWNYQFQDALELARSINSFYSQAEVEVTGHSLGGSLAQVVSQMFGFSGSTFDPGGAYNITLAAEFLWDSYVYSLPIHGTGVPNSFINYRVDNSAVSGLPLILNDHIGKVEKMVLRIF